MKKNPPIIISVFIILSICLGGCTKQNSITDYSNIANWAYFESDAIDKRADVFFVCPTVYFGSGNSYNMDVTDEDTKASFWGATNMEKGIYDADSRFFAPYYRQAGFPVYSMENSERQQYLKLAFDDVRSALKITDVTPEEYSAGIDIFEEGIYHLYDYQFFYRNLQNNVQTRIDSYIAQNK